MDFTTKYLGKTLKSPLVPSPSPLSQDLDSIKQMEDAGAGAVVLFSLFEEQLRQEMDEIEHHRTSHTDSFSEAQSFFPTTEEWRAGPDEYLEHVRKAKKAVGIPVFASLNCPAQGGAWTEFAKKIEQAGADGLELNIYYVAADPAVTGAQIEKTYLDIVKSVTSAVKMPVAVKVSPFFSSLSHFAGQIDKAGARGLVLFNRFYQPDIDLDNLEIAPNVTLSTSIALRLPLTWVGILHGRVKMDLALTGGVHTGKDAIKAIMAGANAAMMCSALLQKGIKHIKTVEKGMKQWMEEREYESIEQMRGSLSQAKSADPGAFERALYLKALATYETDKV
jgi:dihydroorotate dehydrogenase (fumarate)